MSDGALHRLHREGGGVSIPGDTQKLSGQGPGPPAVADPEHLVLDQLTYRGVFQPQPFCDSEVPEQVKRQNNGIYMSASRRRC